MSSPAVPVSEPHRRWGFLFPSLHRYERGWLGPDLIAGLTVWAVLVPESLAYATIAGVSPVVGLYAAPPALILYAAFGSSRQLITGPMSATAALSAAAVADLVTGGPQNFAAFTAMLAIVTGLLALLAGALRLGFLANFISEPVLKGFIIGLALTIMIGQVPKLLGISKGSGNFFEQLGHVVSHLGDTSGTTVAVGLVSLAIVLLLRRIAPVVPGALVAVVAGVLAVQIFNLDEHGVDIVGPIAKGLPAVGLPDVVGFKDYLAATLSAAGIMLIGFAEGLGAAKTYAARTHAEIDANRELIGLGAANVASGLSSGMVVNGSLSKTAVNGTAGARSQLSGVATAVLTVVTLLFLTGLFEDLPEATLAAVVIGAVVELVDFAALTALYRIYTGRLGQIYGHAARPDFIASIAALLGVLVFDTLPGLVIGIVVSALLLIYRASRPHIAELGKVPGTRSQYGDVERHPENHPVAGVVVLRVEGGLWFANADEVRRRILERGAEPDVVAIVVDAETIGAIDVTAVRMLVEVADQLNDGRVTLALAQTLGQVRDVLRSEERVEGGSIELYETVEAACRALAPRGTDPDAP
jgi:high affinity sulfate transporter 1